MCVEGLKEGIRGSINRISGQRIRINLTLMLSKHAVNLLALLSRRCAKDSWSSRIAHIRVIDGICVTLARRARKYKVALSYASLPCIISRIIVSSSTQEASPPRKKTKSETKSPHDLFFDELEAVVEKEQWHWSDDSSRYRLGQ